MNARRKLKNTVLSISGIPRIGQGHAPYLIAEIGTNHNQNIITAKNLINAIGEAGFDCVKFQTYEASEIVGSEVYARDYGLEKHYGDISADEMFSKHLKTPKDWFPELRDMCRELGMDCATTIHGSHGLDWATNMDFDLIKVASMDHNNTPFLHSLVNEIDAPILISFGMARLDDIDAAYDILCSHNLGVGFFHCVSIYPPRSEEMRLSNVPFLRKRFPIPIGFSDHSDDVVASLAALSLGASIFEKHVTMDRKHLGPDHAFALEPKQMKAYVTGIRKLSDNLFAQEFEEPTHKESSMRASYMKSIVAASDLPFGHRLTGDDISLVRPGKGIPPSEIEKIIGRILSDSLKRGEVIRWDHLED